MKFARSIWLLACVALTACASSEGGVTGTGLSAISGNVAVVRDASAARALPFPIRVTIAEFPDIIGTTDDDGTFRLAGEFAGSITLLFANAADGAELGPLPLEVPAGSQTVLENIEIVTAAPVPERVRPQAVRQFDVFGHVDLTECGTDGSGTVLLTDDGRPPRQFMVALSAETTIVRRGGELLTCADIEPGAALSVDGLLRRGDQIIIALGVVVSAPRPPRPSPSPRPEHLRGLVHAVFCDRGVIQVDQAAMPEPVRRAVRLSDQTEFRCQPDAQPPCDCTAVAIGAPIGVIGTIFPERPGQVQADVVFLQSSDVPVDLTGTITRLACDAGGFAVSEDGTDRGVRVAVNEATQIRCAPEVVCRCADLRVRQRVRVEGRQAPEGGAVTAVRIIVLGREP